jgi:CBS domain-containing protein
MPIHLIGPQRLVDITPELTVHALLRAPARRRADLELAVADERAGDDTLTAAPSDRWLADVVVDCPRYGAIAGTECIHCVHRVGTHVGPMLELTCESDGSDRVSEWMSLHPTLTHADDACDRADSLAAAGDAHHLLVLDDKRRLVGVICRCDLAGGGTAPVSSRMQEEVFAIEPRASLALAVAAMKRLAIHCLPVVSGPLLVGILTAGDLARAGVAPR